MKKLKIIEKKDFYYILEDIDKNKYEFNLEFMDIDVLPKVDDYIYMSNNLLDKNYEEYSSMYTFGSLDSKYGRELDSDTNDLIVLEINNEKYYLKRLYG